jgi:hypothetical protein
MFETTTQLAPCTVVRPPEAPPTQIPCQRQCARSTNKQCNSNGSCSKARVSGSGEGNGGSNLNERYPRLVTRSLRRRHQEDKRRRRECCERHDWGRSSRTAQRRPLCPRYTRKDRNRRGESSKTGRCSHRWRHRTFHLLAPACSFT